MARALPPATRMEPTPPAPAAAAAQAPPKAPAEAAAAKGYLLQLGVFSNYANAQALQAKLEQAGIKSYAETRVNVGPFQSKAEADQAMAKIRALGIGAVLVPAH
jgi:DedD protein